MRDPVIVNDNGVSINPDMMEKETLYHCFFQDKLLLFFKDFGDFLNCYEIEEKDLVERARNSDANLEKIFEEYLKDHDLSHSV